MILRHRPLTHWPGTLRRHRVPSPFRSTWSDTLDLLDRELHMLDADPHTVVLQVAVSERDCRLDGQLRADAKPVHPGVILSLDAKQHGPLSYPCDRFESNWRGMAGWQCNVRAIALGLEALRKVDRYGISPNGEQYRGWKQLGTGIALGPAAMTVEDAARLLHDAADVGLQGFPWQDLLTSQKLVDTAYRYAVKDHHPDVGGDAALFRRLSEARDLLKGLVPA